VLADEGEGFLALHSAGAFEVDVRRAVRLGNPRSGGGNTRETLARHAVYRRVE
jgi:hypothetical protein